VTMGEIPMPGGWSLSMAWLPMCGQSWLGAATCFVGMWTAMMVAMMLPSLLPVLWGPGLARGTGAGTAYFAVWSALGAIVFAGGAAFAQAALAFPAVSRAVPLATGLVVLLAGAWQFTAWKARHLACCRPAIHRGTSTPADCLAPLRDGLRLGLHCCRACAGLTAILLAAGVMDWRAMAVITVAITGERLAPAGWHVEWAAGAVAVTAGALLINRTAWLA
jgi:predicted metal-binding membrane protein